MHRTTRAQALIVVLILMFIAGLIGLGLSRMWGSDSSTRVLDEDSVVAFYVAEAGLERGKAYIWVYNTTTSWTGYTAVGLGNHSVTITNPSVYRFSINSTGRYHNAQRTLHVNVTTSGAGPGTAAVDAGSWRED